MCIRDRNIIKAVPMIKIDGVQIVINSVYERGLRQELLDKVFFLLSCIDVYKRQGDRGRA